VRVSEIRIAVGAETCELRGWVESDASPDETDWFAPFPLWWRFPARCAPFLRVDNGDPWLAALLVLAMQTGEDLTIPAPVSPRLLGALADIQAVFTSFYKRLRPVTIVTSARGKAWPDEDAGVGLFFSLGVDSYYSLMKNRREHPADSRSLTHLISVNGFDVTYEGDDGEFRLALLRNFERVAAAFDLTLVPVSTNIRRVGVRLVPWTALHGAALASVVLALGGFFRRISIAASTTYDKLYPWGSHPVLDPLWSTETLEVVHDGCELNTIDKTAVVAQLPLALETLRPCAGHGDEYNCGRCEKCLRTMLDLLAAGALERCQTLPHEIEPEWVRDGIRPGGPIHVADYQRRLDALSATGRAPAVCQALAAHLALGMNPRFTGSARRVHIPATRNRLADAISRLFER
jgi:hypothetical protein